MSIAIFAPHESRFIPCHCPMLEGVTTMIADIFDGPGSQSGKLYYFERPGIIPVAQYDAEHQHWIDCGEYWIGYDKRRKPRPEHLQRDKLIDGHPVKLCDGNEWVIPICDFVPKRLTIDRETGEEKKVPFAEDREFIARSNELFALFISDEFLARVEEEHRVVIPNGLTYAAEALAKNYRINLELVDALELIGEIEAFEIAKVAAGMTTLELVNFQKKTESLAAASSSA